MILSSKSFIAHHLLLKSHYVVNLQLCSVCCARDPDEVLGVIKFGKHGNGISNCQSELVSHDDFNFTNLRPTTPAVFLLKT